MLYYVHNANNNIERVHGWAGVSVCTIRDIVNRIRIYVYKCERVLSMITAHTNKYASSLT